jgi:hypothetical protein
VLGKKGHLPSRKDSYLCMLFCSRRFVYCEQHVVARAGNRENCSRERSLDRSLFVINKGYPVLPILTFTLVRTGLRGKPNQLNSLSPPCKMVERGSKASYEKGVKSLSPVLSPNREKRTGEELTKSSPHFHPGLAEMRISTSCM